MHTHGELRRTAADARRVVDSRTVHQRGCRRDEAMLAGIKDAVVLAFAQTEIVGIDD